MKVILRVAVVVAVTATAASLGFAVPAAHATNAAGEVIAAAPMYGSGPSDPQWSTLLNSTGGLPKKVILNTFNGTSTQPFDSAWQALAHKLHQKGVEVLAYVYTNYGADSAATVEARIDQYFQPGSVPGDTAPDGVLFDEFPSANCNDTTWAAAIANYAYGKIAGLAPSGFNAIMWANPGTAIPTCYLNLNDSGAELYDTFVTTENTESGFNTYIPYNVLEPNGTYSDGSADGYASYRFAKAVYEVPATDIDSVIDRAYSNYAGYVYTTPDGADGNPWDNFPSNSYLNSEVRYAATK